MMFHALRRIRVFIFLFFACARFFSQSYSFTGYGVEEGLPYIQVYTLYQDHKGYLWSGGYGGLSYFDGKKFTTFGPKNGLSNHWVTSITEDHSGSLWIGTIDGLSILQDKKFRVLRRADGLMSDYINNLFTDRFGKIWVATDSGVNYFDNGKIKNISVTAGFNVQCIYMDGDANMWAATTKGLMKFSPDGNLLGMLDAKSGLSNENVTVVKQDMNGKIIAGTRSGLVIMDRDMGAVQIFSVTTGLFDPNVLSLLVDLKNNLWIGTNSSLVKFDGKKFSYLSLSNETNSNKISALLLDYEQNIWLGTYDGLFKFRGEGLVNFGPADGLKDPFIFQITNDKTGNLWIGTDNGGVYYYDGINFKNYSVKDGLPSAKVNAILVLDDERTLFGTDAGYSILRKNKFENYSIENGFNLISVNTFFRDRKGRIWTGSKNSLAYLTENAQKKFDCTYFTLPTTIKNYDVWGFAEDKFGNIWIGTYLAGLYKFDGKQITAVDPAPGKKSHSVLEIVIKDGIHFFGATLEGILYINLEKNETRYITENEGLNSDLTYAVMLARDKKTLWAGTNQGINKLNIEPFLKGGKPEVVTFGKTEGLKGVESNSHGLYEDRSGTVWIGTVNGLSRFNPAEYTPNTVKPKLNLTSIKLFYGDTALAEETELPYDLNNISFEYIGICLTNPLKVRYVCKLEGFDKNWSPETPENFKTYSNLPPGRYTFKVRSCNNESIWNDNALTYSFTILSPWYTSWWFILAVVATVVSAIVTVFRIRLRIERKRQKTEMQTQIEISKNELKALRAQINPHFIFNSLNSIQHFIVENDNDEASRYLNKFAKLFRMILNNSEKSTVSVQEEIDMLQIYLELESMRFNNKFDYEFVVDPKIDPDYEQIPPMLLQPYIENSILHGLTPKKERGKLTIKINTTGSFLICSIEDNGIGRKLSGEIKTSPKASEKYRSMGMKITQDRLSLLNSINNSELSMNVSDLYNEKGEAAGTRVDIYIPIT
jgi:ligand-binding sensor domain-containing protein